MNSTNNEKVRKLLKMWSNSVYVEKVKKYCKMLKELEKYCRMLEKSKNVEKQNNSEILKKPKNGRKL